MPAILLIHLCWTTYRRMPMIESSTARFLRRFLPAEAQRHGAQVLALGMVRDHVHLVLRLPSRFDLPRLVQGLKGASSRLVNRDVTLSTTGLRWDAGYHAGSVSRRQLPNVIAYVGSQERRHPERAVAGEPAGEPAALQGVSRSAEPGL